ncbi:MAG TPA: glycosyl hydrolase family 18 protein, partial [Solirubrobacteraceae bacterium]|nr:glycosyl hydrolase family 18 protein [Solirubrobacteraceae bacterium]
MTSSALMVSSLAAAGAANAAVGGAHGKPLPYRIFAPYFEAWDTTAGGPAAQSQASGDKFLTLAFLQTPASGSCAADWNGDPTQPISQTTFGSDIAAIQARGGDVIPSFGGYTADTTNTEIADSCTNIQAIADVYESLITTYGISRIDMDVEADSLSNTAGIDRRNQAIALTEAWAAQHHRQIQFSYTLPTFATGLTGPGLYVLQSAVANGARIDTVNLMTFDYWYGTQQDMLADSESAATGLVAQLQTLYPGVSARALWHMVGITEMPGIDDYGPDETLTTADASPLLRWADQQGVGFLSFWALQRDNGGCVGTKGAGDCSG